MEILESWEEQHSVFHEGLFYLITVISRIIEDGMYGISCLVVSESGIDQQVPGLLSILRLDGLFKVVEQLPMMQPFINGHSFPGVHGLTC